MLDEETKNNMIKLSMRMYEEGLIHGFVVGRGKQPRPEDERMLDDLRKNFNKKITTQWNERNADDGKGYR